MTFKDMKYIVGSLYRLFMCYHTMKSIYRTAIRNKNFELIKELISINLHSYHMNDGIISDCNRWIKEGRHKLYWRISKIIHNHYFKKSIKYIKKLENARFKMVLKESINSNDLGLNMEGNLE